jgi:hypothetical protein
VLLIYGGGRFFSSIKWQAVFPSIGIISHEENMPASRYTIWNYHKKYAAGPLRGDDPAALF